MKTYFIDVLLHHYADFSGRATRKQYWLFWLWCIIVAFLIDIIAGILKLGMIPNTVLTLLLIIPNLAIFFRRVRDTGHSIYWGLLAVPFYLPYLFKYLPENVLNNAVISAIASLIFIACFLCSIPYLIFALLPSKK